MNFLSHYFKSAISQQPSFNAGLILPDLLRKDIRHFQKTNPNFSLEINQLIKGCHQHQSDDKHFHSSDFFNKWLKLFLHEINTHPQLVNLPRKWFVAHIALEMLIDRILLKHYPNLVHQFYEDLLLVQTESYVEFLAIHGITNNSRLLNRWSQFNASQYIKNYTCNQLFAYSIWRIMTNVGIQEVSKETITELVELLQKLEESFFLDRYSLIFDLKQIGQ